MEQPQTYSCPLCGELGLSDNDLRDHVTRQHADSANTQEVVSYYNYLATNYSVVMEICPVCAAHPSGNPNHLTNDFSGHLMLDHSRSLRDADLISFLLIHLLKSL